MQNVIDRLTLLRTFIANDVIIRKRFTGCKSSTRVVTLGLPVRFLSAYNFVSSCYSNTGTTRVLCGMCVVVIVGIEK